MSWLSKACKKLKKISLKQVLPVIGAVTALIPGVGVLAGAGLAAVSSAVGKVGGAIGRGATQAIGTAIQAVQGVAALGTVTEQQVAATGGPLASGMLPKKIKPWMLIAGAAILGLFWFGKKGHHSSGNPGSHARGTRRAHRRHHSGSKRYLVAELGPKKKRGFGDMTRAERLRNLAKARRVLAARRAAGTVKHHVHRKHKKRG